MTERACSTGELILSKGEISSNVFVVIRGKIKIELKEDSFFLTDGDLFGEEGLFFDKPAPYNAVSVEETLVQTLDEKEAREHIFNNPDVSFSVFIKNFGQIWRDFKPFSPTSNRYIRILEELVPFVEKTDGDTPDNVANISIEELADKVQTTYENLLHDLKRSKPFGHLDIKGGQKIMTAGKRKLMKIIYESYRESFFSNSDKERGSGSHTLLALLKKENESIFNRN